MYIYGPSAHIFIAERNTLIFCLTDVYALNEVIFSVRSLPFATRKANPPFPFLAMLVAGVVGGPTDRRCSLYKASRHAFPLSD
jgi:hypothetical protein